ncbi:MAG: hydrolase [Sphingobium sp.]|nr:hydrolase [Sphingobium sp.]MCP5399548.1 hydrolase [Sphingomonas sp.]
MKHISALEQEILQTAGDTPMLDQVRQWAKVNSGSHNLDGLTEMASLLADAFSVLPGALRLVDGEPMTSIAPDGHSITRQMGQHMMLSVRPDAEKRILLTGHMDTVFAADHPFQALTWLDDATLNGPGVADMKGGIALMLAALKAFEASPIAASLGYDVLINSDEEVGSFSSAPLIARMARDKLAALTYEPALPDGTLAGARAGSGNFSIHIAGRSAHAGRNPEDGRNALLAAADLAMRLADGAKAIGLPCNPAKIDGGGPNNMVPDLAILRVNFRPGSPEIQAAAQQLVDDSIAAIIAAHEVSAHAHGGFNRPPKPLDPGAQRLFALVKEAGSDLGLDISWRDTGGVCDGNNIAACGVPVVDTMGARGGAIHSSDEYLIVDSLAERARLSALTIARIAQRGAL